MPTAGQPGATAEQWPPSLAHAKGGDTSMLDKAKDAASQAADRAREAVGTMTHQAGDMASAVGHQVEDWTDDFTGLVRRYPVQSVLVCVGIGFLFGELLGSDR